MEKCNIARISFALLIGLALVGCGSTDTQVFPSANSSANGSTVVVNNNPARGELTVQAREDQIEAIFAKARELPQTDEDAYLSQLRDFMVTQPNIVEASVFGGTAYAYFSDGQPIFVSISRPGGPVTNPRTLSQAPKVAAQADSGGIAPLAEAASELPRSKDARLINLFQSGGSSFTASTPKVSKMLTQVGYQPTAMAGSLADYRTLGGGIGLLYIDGHGLTFRKASVITGSTQTLGEDVFALESADLVPTTPNGKLDLSRESLGEDLVVGPNGEPPAVIRGMVSEDLFGFNKRAHYFITRTFVNRYMSNFSEHAFVFLNTCHSSSPSALKFLTDLKAKRATTYVGWSDRVHDADASSKGPLLMDRFLGANSEEVSPKENPAQRPFSVDPVLSWFGTPFLILPGELQKSGDNALLAPSIQFIDVTDQFHLELHGKFGSNPGADGVVRLGETVLTYDAADWKPDSIKCRSSNFLVDGEVEVSANGGIKSNRVPLTTAYNCDVSFNPGAVSKVSSSPTSGAFSEIVTNDVETWTGSVGTLADRHGFRETPGGAVTAHTGIAAASRTAKINSATRFGTITYKARSGGSPTDVVQDILVRPTLTFPFFGVAFSRDEGNGVVSVSVSASAPLSEAHHPTSSGAPPDYGFPLLVRGVGNVTVDSNGAFQGRDLTGTPFEILFTPRSVTPPSTADSVPR